MTKISIPMDDVNNDDTPNEVVREKAKYDYSAKMKQNREGWSIARISSVSVQVPIAYTEFVKGAAMAITGAELISKIDAHDTDIIEVFANKRPTGTFNVLDMMKLIEELELADENSVHAKEGRRLVAMLRQKEEDHRDGEIAAQNGDEVALMYHFAREYAYAYYIKGAYMLLMYSIAGGVDPFPRLT